ncbi:hypothetical protein C1N60_02540 [Pantoea sp. SGAir0184]
MKRNIIALSLFALISTGVQAADGTINFTGKITDQTCDIDAGTGAPIAVTMGNIGADQFKAKGDTALPTEFSISLKSCPGVPSVSVKFDGTANAGDNSIIDLTSGANAATGIGLQIQEVDGTPIKLLSNSKAVPITSGAADAKFRAVYISTADAEDITAGDANATASFDIVYN